MALHRVYISPSKIDRLNDWPEWFAVRRQTAPAADRMPRHDPGSLNEPLSAPVDSATDDGPADLPASDRRLASGTRCCQCSRTGAVLWSMLALVAALLLIPDWRGQLDVEKPGTLCNNSLDLGGLAGSHRELGNTCEELITKREYSCEFDFCTDGSCTLGGLCDLACRTKPNCDNMQPPELRTCLHHALGRVEGMVILVYIFAWVNLMFPALLPLARCTTALASAALIVTVRKLGHEVVPHILEDGEEVSSDNPDCKNAAAPQSCAWHPAV